MSCVCMFTNCRGDEGIDANGRDRRLGEPVTGHAILERARMFGTPSADYITASGHSGRIAMEASLQAKTGRIHDRTRTFRSIVRFLLHRGHQWYGSRPRRRGEISNVTASKEGCHAGRSDRFGFGEVRV